MDNDHVPWALIDKVCSPGGTTITGLLAMEEANFTTAVTKAIDAVVAKDNELMEKNKISYVFVTENKRIVVTSLYFSAKDLLYRAIPTYKIFSILIKK